MWERPLVPVPDDAELAVAEHDDDIRRPAGDEPGETSPGEAEPSADAARVDLAKRPAAGDDDPPEVTPGGAASDALTEQADDPEPAADPEPAPAAPPAPPAPPSYWLRRPARLAGDWRVVLAVFALLAAFYYPGLGSYGLFDPWETHYGEVARNMVEYDNYIDPWWGSPWDTKDVKREREGFYSKPLLVMWMTSAGMNLFGYTELGVRFFFPLIVVLALLAVYLAVSRFYTRRAGIIAVLVLGSAPFYAFMSRQAVTDGPLVALITAGMMALCLGLFGGDEDDEASPWLYGFTVGLLVLVILGQLWAILPMDRSPDVVRPYPGDRGPLYALQWWFTEVWTVGRGKGWVISALLVPLGAWAAWRVAHERRRRMLYIYLFYICCGLVVPAKGWLGWAPMGLSIIGYLIVTGEWKLLTRVDIPTGLLIVFMTGHPWIVAMIGGHHPGWWNRFIVHDHYKRLFSGVHSIDDGAFEYFFRWIGYGLFPWIGLLPAALVRAFGRLRTRGQGLSPQQRFELMMVLWAIFGFFLFTKSSTKFHHYIFPIIPPLAILIALFVEWALARRGRNLALLLVCAGALTMWVGQDMYRMPAAHGQSAQNLVNLFTYKYDREWSEYTSPARMEKLEGEAKQAAEDDNVRLWNMSNPLRMMTFFAVAGLLMMALRREWLREAGFLALGYAGLWCAWWCLQEYLPVISADWSQKGMWSAYYDDCSKYGPDEEDEFRRHLLLTSSRVPTKLDTFPSAWCKEPFVAFRTNWRGETFYSANTVLPSMETKYLAPFLEQWGDKPFYLFTERSRVKSELEPNLPDDMKGQYREVAIPPVLPADLVAKYRLPERNLKFVLLRVEKGTKPAEPAEPAQKDKATPTGG